MSQIVFDTASKRTMDTQGFMHVSQTHITKAGIRPYMGRELPGWKKLGLEPEKVYAVLCPPEELEKVASTFNGLHLLLDHAEDSATAPQKELRVGTIGTSPVWNNPYLDNDMSVTDSTAIALIENGERVELSASYGFTTVVESGVYEGQPFDLKMTNIHGNHVALVEEGRAGGDVRVADQKPSFMEKTNMDEKAIAALVMKILGELGLIKSEAAPAVNDQETPEQAATKETIDASKEKPVNDQENPEVELENKEKAQAADVIVNTKTEKVEHPGAPDVVMDAALKAAKADIHAAYKASAEAARECRNFLGDVDPLVFDSADAIYGKALEQAGYDPKAFPDSAWRGMVKVLNDRSTVESPIRVSDSAGSISTVEIDDKILSRIKR